MKPHILTLITLSQATVGAEGGHCVILSSKEAETKTKRNKTPTISPLKQNHLQEKLCWLKHLWPMLLFKVGQEAGERTLSLIVIFQTYFSNCLIHYNYVQLFMNLLLCSVLLSKLGSSLPPTTYGFSKMWKGLKTRHFSKTDQILIWI